MAAFERQESYISDLDSVGGLTPMGYCPALLFLKGVEPDNHGVTMEPSHSEAACVPCHPLDGKLIITGLASGYNHARTSVQSAVLFVREHLERLTTLLGTPSIDFEKRVRLNSYGKPIKDGAVDIILRVPPYFDSALFAASMVMAIITMIWRKPSLRDWSVAGTVRPDGMLIGFPIADELYLEEADNCRFKTIVLSKSNAEAALTAATAQRLDLQQMQMRVISCETMMDVVRAAMEHWNGLQAVS